MVWRSQLPANNEHIDKQLRSVNKTYETHEQWPVNSLMLSQVVNS